MTGNIQSAGTLSRRGAMILAGAAALGWGGSGSAADADGGLAEHGFDLAGRARRYLLFLPPGHDRTRPAPLLLVFHGGGGTAESMARIMDTHAKAARMGMITAYPQSLYEGFNAGPGVDGKAPNFGQAVAEGVDDVAYVSRVIDDVGAHAKVDPRRVFAAGWSNGSAMSFRLAVQLSDRIAAVAGAMSELSLMDPLTMRRPVPMMYIWGTKDPIMRPGSPPKAELAARMIQRLIALDRCAPTPVEVIERKNATRRTWRGAAEGSEVVEWRLEGSGHWWPGLPIPAASREKVEARFGPLVSDINATDEILPFFLHHPMPT